MRKIQSFILILLLTTLQVFSQTRTGYNIIVDHYKGSSDSAKLESALLPNSILNLGESNANNKDQEEKLPVFRASTINKGFAVGSTKGIADVTQVGAASYQISIQVPQGVSGFEPSLSINYNSQAGYGLLGYGWNLNAFSSITRTGKSFYYDNEAEAAQLSNSDNLLLDGQRLILLSGQNLSNGAKYRLENDPLTDITYKTVNSLPCFVIRTKDGVIREFGSTSTSNIEVSGGSTLLWLLSKVKDLSGNTITYDYEEIAKNGEFYISKILYAGNRSIRFAYEARNDKHKSYYGGVEINANKVLKSISTYIDQTQIRKYQLNYMYDGFYSKLTEIVESGQNGERYNSTIIDYGTPEHSSNEYFATLSEKRQGNMPIFADFDGDGRTDFLSFPEKDSYTTSDVATLFLAYDYYGTVSFTKTCTIPIQSASGVFQGFLLADLNGDGKIDVVNISKALNGTYRYNYYMYNNGKLTYNYDGFNTNANGAIAGDFNGDGKQEILVLDNQKVFDEKGREVASGGVDNWGKAYVEKYYPNNRYLCDINGNGKADILVMDESGAWLYELEGNRFARQPAFNTTLIKNYYFPYFGDFNGDGKTDVLIQNIQNGNIDDVHIIFSTGKGYVKKAVTNADIRARVFVGDFNKDGITDIFHLENINDVIRMKVGTFNGVDFTTKHYSTIAPSKSFDIDEDYAKCLFQVADFDGDGRAEFCNARYVDSYIIHPFTDNQTLLVKSITDGLGAQTSFEYAPITDKAICSNTDNNVLFPVSGHTYPLYVVRNMWKKLGNDIDNMIYRYKNPKLHLQGKGFLGFQEIEIDYYNQNKKTITKYGYNSFYAPFISERKTTTRAGANISSEVYEHSYISQGSKRYIPYIKKTTETDYLSGTTKTSECASLDSWGNPLTLITKYGSDVTETINSTYYNNGTENEWIFSQLRSSTKQTTRGSESWIEKKTFDYNSRNLPTNSENFTKDGTKKTSQIQLEYDSFGNIIVENIKPYTSSNVLTTKYEYSTDGVAQIKEIDPQGLSTSLTYNASGQINSKTNPLGKKTTYSYDGMGRLIKTIYPDQTSSTVAFSWGSSVSNSVYFIKLSSGDNLLNKRL